MAHFLFIFHSLSFELNFSFDQSFPLTVKMYLVSYFIGWRPSYLTASLDVKSRSLPEPVSRCTRNVSPCISTRAIGGSDSFVSLRCVSCIGFPTLGVFS